MYFVLKEPNSDDKTLIILKHKISGVKGRLTVSTGLKIHPSEWSKESKMPIRKRGRLDLANISRKLTDYANFLQERISYYQFKKIPFFVEDIKKEIQNEFSINRTNTKQDRLIYFTDFAVDFLNKSSNYINTKTGNVYTKSNIKQHKSTIKRIVIFEQKTNQRIKLNDFNLDYYSKLVSFLKVRMGYSINTTGTIIKNAKALLSKAEELGFKVHQDYKKQAFKVLREQTQAIALNEIEVDRIFNHDFSNDPILENCRDLAIIGLWTGLRVSDLLSLPEIDPKQDFITVQPKKTKNSTAIKVVIPLHHHIKEVITKRGMPESMSDINFNIQFKDVCKEVGINNVIEGSILQKDDNIGLYRKVPGKYEKYKLVSSHTCRRSFATNLYKMNFPTLSIMKITGHTSEKTFLNYIKVTPTEHAEKLLEHWNQYYKNKKIQ